MTTLCNGRVTAQREDNFSDIGGLEKILPLENLAANARGFAAMDVTTDFASEASETYLSLEFFDAQDRSVATYISSRFKGQSQGVAVLDGVEIPASAVRVSVLPLVRLADDETGGFTWDNLRFAVIE